MTDNITNNEKAKKYLKRLETRQKICNAVMDLYWVYLPLGMLWLTLGILNVPNKIIGFPDMIVTSAVLFGEAISRVYKSGNLSNGEKDGAFYFGISGFMVSTLLLAINLIRDHSDINKQAFSINDNLYTAVLASVWIISFVYAVKVRMITSDESAAEKAT